MLVPFITILILFLCLCPSLFLSIQANLSDSSRTMPKPIKSHAAGPLRLRRNALTSADCIIPSGQQHPCILKPILKDIPTQKVLSETLSSAEYEVYIEAEEGSTLYLPCNTLRELQNETVIWDHNISTVAVMGTLFTMDSRYDATGPPENKFRRCAHPYALYLPPRDFFVPQHFGANGVYETWELVIVGVEKKDSGNYHCRLTGNQSQSLVYHLKVEKSAHKEITSTNNLLTINAPRYTRRHEPANFICSMKANHGDFSQVIVDWYRVTPDHKDAGGQRLIETQDWNNISVYKEILGDLRSGLRLNAVMQIHSTDFQHDGIYECQAHRITHDQQPRVYASFLITFTVLPRWQYQQQASDMGLCRERTTEFPPVHESPNGAESRVVLSDSPTERQPIAQIPVETHREPQLFPSQNWIPFLPSGQLTSATERRKCINSFAIFFSVFLLSLRKI